MTTAVTPVQYPLVNGSAFSFSSIEMNLGGQIFRGFKSINYGRKRDRPKHWGNNTDPLFKVVGKNDYTADGELYFAEFHNWLSILGPGYGDTYFTTTVTFTQQNFQVVQAKIFGCTLDEVTASFSEGTDALSMKFALDPLKIILNINGVDLDDNANPLTSPPQGP